MIERSGRIDYGLARDGGMLAKCPEPLASGVRVLGRCLGRRGDLLAVGGKERKNRVSKRRKGEKHKVLANQNMSCGFLTS